MSEGMAAYGTLLKIGDGYTPEVFTAIAEVNKIGGPGLSLEPIDITHHESPNAWKEKVGGLLDGGEVSMDVNFLPTEFTQAGDSAGSLLYAMINRLVTNFQLVWPDSGATTWEFPALVTKFEPDAPADGKLGAAITLEISGEPTIPLESVVPEE